MSKLKRIVITSLLLLLPSVGLTQTAESSVDLFQQGTQSYTAKDYKKSQELYQKALSLDPSNATVLTNLALTEFQLGNKPLAIGLLRKALASDPDLQTAQAGLKYISEQTQIRQIPHKIQTYESIRNAVLQPVPLSAFLTLSALLFLAAGWTLINFFGRRRRALLEEQALPGFPVIASVLALGFVIFTGLLALKIYDGTVTRATIIEEKVSVQTAPGDNQVAILELFGGMEVITHDVKEDWVQVTYPGSLTGWIKKSSLLMTR